MSGTSEITVSRVMRGSPVVSQNLRDRVMLAANQLGYTPNRLAGALKTQSSNLVAVIVPPSATGFFPKCLMA
jgi:LacI family gluconate utilization system Gnt-I transcriptional repressor